ncbi:DUF1801 domain-containing protein [Paraflavitalea sp. CAU 1676]|uniref:DUF1801 domain-containing protein n=1 Tax=Paraflavitalea sp. CAU 1676 TaxID=3032598 RepID=UPI0023DB6395|nr:DUF1801 domain-containing protein [Paraflavitalea sp. CAU 1676]MDF2192686.1 DUF1801 domain-containing protein [Paraflavitalea sp. CAU 1676]
MSSKITIDQFVEDLKHPLKSEMQAVIKIIRQAGPDLEEDIKWGGPSFDYKEPMATFNPRVKEYVAVIFHRGEILEDKSGVLEPGPKGKAYAKFYSMGDVTKHKGNLAKVVKQWIKLMKTK